MSEEERGKEQGK